MPENEYSDYVGREVYVLLDGGAAPYYDNRLPNSSIPIQAKLILETETKLRLEDIKFECHRPLCGSFRSATINKDYVIGVFEKDEKTDG